MITSEIVCRKYLDNYAMCGSYKGKGKIHPTTGHEGPEVEKRYSSTLSLTSALYGGCLFKFFALPFARFFKE